MREIYKLTTTFILFVLYTNVMSAQELLPTSTTGEIVKHQYYTLSYSESHEQAEWVCYELTPSLINGSQSRTDNFRSDPLVKTGSAQLDNYKGSGYDRGHLCPAGDMKVSKEAMSETFYMSNMSPQHPSFNRGIWKKLESTVRNWAIVEGKVYVVTGGVLTSKLGAIGTNQVTVPKYYYKVIYDPTGDEKMIALVLPNQKGVGQLQDYVVTVDSVEILTGIDFFPALEDNLENKLESNINANDWEFEQYRSSSSSTESKAVQCKGIAKSTGVRCKNKTTNANGYCYLHQDQANGKTVTKPKTTTSSDGRCQAITKSGTRCKRKAEAGSKYCWQHKK